MNNIEILEDYIEALRKPKPFKYTNEQKAEAIENLIQENKELKEKLQQYKKIEEIANTITDDDIRNAIKNVEKDYIPKSKVKEKIQKDIKINEHVILGGRRNGKTLEYGKRLGRIEMCEELLKEGE